VIHDSSSPGKEKATGSRRSHKQASSTDLVAGGKFGRMVCHKAGKMAGACLDEVLEKIKFMDPANEIAHAAHAAGATFGDSA
jgi:hypothetical protein